MSILLADIDATCAALGYYDGEKYHAEPDAIQGLKHLIWILRRDIDNHEYRRHLGRAKVLQTDLVPMLPDYINDSDYFDVLIRLIVILTNPTLLLYRDGLPKDGPGRRIYLELVEILQGYKSAFTTGNVWAALTTKLHKTLETEWSIRSEEQGLLIERILVLVRNVLQVPANPELECRADNDASLHDQVIWALQQSGMLDLVLYILSSADENQYHLHALEIVCLMFREQSAESLADASLQRSAAEKHRDEEELIAVRKREKLKQVARPPPARHSRFGGTYVLQNVKSISDRDVICHQSLERAVSLDFDREKTKLKKSHRIVREDVKAERRSAFSVRLCLREYCIEILRSAYNTLVRHVRRVLERSSSTGSGANDDSYLLWAIRFFLEFNRLSGMQLELVSESLSIQCFHWVLTRIQHDMDMITSDKKQAQLWGRRLHVGIKTFRELLLSLVELKRQPDEKAQALFNMLLNNICYVLEYRETILHLLIFFNESYSTKSYLRDIIETANVFIKLMEKFCQVPVVVQDKRRNKAKAGRKAQHKQREQPKEEDHEELENMWTNIVTELATVLAQPEVDLPEEERPIPFDAASEKSIDDQKDDCMLRIYKFLREEKPEESVILLRAAREVWPENDCFGAITAAPEDELMLLREIFFSKLGPVEKPSENDENQENGEEEDESEDDENEEEDEPQNVEKDFKFEDFAKRLLNPKIVRACTIALSDWETMPTKSLRAAVTILYRIAYGLKCFAMLYQANLFKIFQKVFNTPRDKHNEELRRLGIYVVRQFVEMAPKNPKIFAELLFYKTLKEANDLENGYADTYHGATKGAWTEEQEIELRMLFDENQRNPQTDQDVIDWILDNLIDKTRTRRGVLKKLKEMGLMFKAPTKKSTASAAQKNLWQHEEDETLKNLYDEFRLESDCLARIMDSFGERRSKNSIIKRMLQLGLIADKSEIIPQKLKNPRTKKPKSSGSDKPEKISRRKPKSKPPRKSKGKKSTIKSPLDIGSVKFLTAQVDENLKDAVEWLKDALKEAAADFEEVSEDNDDGVPLLPLQSVEKEAVEDETFKRLLISLGIQPPIEEADTYWKIPVYLHAADLKLRVAVLDGTYNPTSDENGSVHNSEIGGDESGDESEGSQDSEEGSDTSATDSSDNDDNESVSGSESHQSIISKRRERFDNLVFNQSDNEDEHREPLKRTRTKSKKTGIEGSIAESNGRQRSKKININDMLMDGDSDKDKDNENEIADNDTALEDFDSENLRKRLAELVDDDEDDNVANETKSKTEKSRRTRRNIIDSDSSDGEEDTGMGNNGNTNQNNSINGADSQKNDYQSSITINGNNKVNIADDKPRQQHVDRNNQSSSSLANSSGELGDFPSNSLRMSPTPEDEDYAAANVNVDNNKRSRQDINAGSADDGEGDEIVAKKKKLHEKDTGNRRWASIIDDDSD